MSEEEEATVAILLSVCSDESIGFTFDLPEGSDFFNIASTNSLLRASCTVTPSGTSGMNASRMNFSVVNTEMNPMNTHNLPSSENKSKQFIVNTMMPAFVTIAMSTMMLNTLYHTPMSCAPTGIGRWYRFDICLY